MDQISKIRTRHVLAASCFFFVIAAIFILSSSSSSSTPPSLDEVLKKSGPSFNWGFAFLGLLGFSFSTLSIVKAYDIFRKSSDRDEKELKVETMPGNDEIKAELAFISTQLKQKEGENVKLFSEIKRMQEVVKERLSNEDVLKKSNFALRKECEKLVTEKEKLVLEASRKEWPELAFVPAQKEKTVKKTAAVKKVSKIKSQKKAIKRRK